VLLARHPRIAQVQHLGRQPPPRRVVEQDRAHLRIVLSGLHDEGHDRRRESAGGVALARGEIEAEAFASLESRVAHEGLEAARGGEIPEVAAFDAAAEHLAGAAVGVAHGALGIDEQEAVGATAGEFAHRFRAIDLLCRRGSPGRRRGGRRAAAQLLAQARELLLHLRDAPALAQEIPEHGFERRQVGPRDEGVATGLVSALEHFGDRSLLAVEDDARARGLRERLHAPAHFESVDTRAQLGRDHDEVEARFPREREA